MIDFTQNQTLTGEQFFAAWEANSRAEAAYQDARIFVETAELARLKNLLTACHFIIFPYAAVSTKEWPFNHERMYKREFRAWIDQSQIHTFCYYWESNRMMVITAFSSDGISFWDYCDGRIIRIEKPADRQDFK